MHMQLLWEVIDELYTFAIDAIVSLFAKKEYTVAPMRLAEQNVIALGGETVSEVSPTPTSALQLAQEAQVVTETADEAPSTFRDLSAIIAESHKDARVPGVHTIMYAGSGVVPVYVHPTREFDGVIHTIMYGDMVMVSEWVGRFARVVVGTITGYILREDLIDRAAFVYPEFTIGLANGPDDPNTIRLRTMIGDVFGGGVLEYALQAGEYVVYKLKRKGIVVPWTAARPRVPGRWHVLLKGIRGVHSGVTPKTGAIMECTLHNDIGHVAYVEAVFPNETISISEANYPDSGIYNERTLTRDEWREMKPIFIQIMA